MSSHKIQQFHLTTVAFWIKPCILGPIKQETPWRNWLSIFYFSVTTSSWTFTDVKYCLFDGDEQGLPSFAVQNSRNPWKQFGCGSNHKWITSRSIRCLGRKDCIRISTWTTQVVWWWVIWKKVAISFSKTPLWERILLSFGDE